MATPAFITTQEFVERCEQLEQTGNPDWMDQILSLELSITPAGAVISKIKYIDANKKKMDFNLRALDEYVFGKVNNLSTCSRAFLETLSDNTRTKYTSTKPRTSNSIESNAFQVAICEYPGLGRDEKPTETTPRSLLFRAIEYLDQYNEYMTAKRKDEGKRITGIYNELAKKCTKGQQVSIEDLAKASIPYVDYFAIVAKDDIKILAKETNTIALKIGDTSVNHHIQTHAGGGSVALDNRIARFKIKSYENKKGDASAGYKLGCEIKDVDNYAVVSGKRVCNPAIVTYQPRDGPQQSELVNAQNAFLLFTHNRKIASVLFTNIQFATNKGVSLNISASKLFIGARPEVIADDEALLNGSSSSRKLDDTADEIE